MDVSALLQGPEMELDGISSELNTNGFVVLNRASDQKAAQIVVNNIVKLTDHLQAAVNEVWPNRFGSRYKRVKVLLVSWDADDLGVIKEVNALEHVFVDFYRYDVSTYTIPIHHPDLLLTRRVVDFVESAQKDTLLIFYYAGHAYINPHRHESIIWSANREKDSPALTSNGIQALLEAADSDALLLYDCCYSADTAMAPAHSSRGATELIAACGFEGIAAEVGEHSFTNGLIHVLVLASSEAPFSASQLHSRVIQQLKSWKPSPTRDATGRFVQDPYGRLVLEPQRRRTPVYCNLVHDDARKPIILSKIPPPPVLENFPLPLDSGSTFFRPNLSVTTAGSQLIGVDNAAFLNQTVARNHDLIITVKIVDDVVAGQRVPSYDAWLEWLRSAPPEADRIGIHIAETTSSQLEVDRNESHQGSVQRNSMDGAGVCSSPWIQIPLSQCHRRGPWTKAEDAYLANLVNMQGALNWVRIAQHICSRSPKQCRERYHQNLKPSLNHEPITPEEGLQIERLVGEIGKRWPEIARRLHGRSDNAVKNWWNGSINRRRGLVLRRRTPDQYERCFDGLNQRLIYTSSIATTNGSV